MPDETELLSPLCRQLFSYMAGLDNEGLNWDPKEAVGSLRPVMALEEELVHKQARIEFLERALHLAAPDVKLTVDYMRLVDRREVAPLAGEKQRTHSPDCWKNVATRDLGVGGKLASCTCGYELEEGKWYWVRIGLREGEAEGADNEWFPALRRSSSAGGWTNEDTWEDFDDEVVEWRRILPPDAAWGAVRVTGPGDL